MKLSKLTSAALVLGLASLLTHVSKADVLTGDTVRATIFPGGGITVTNQFTSPQVIGPGVEFNGSIRLDQFSLPYDISADFGTDDLTLVFTTRDHGLGIVNTKGGSVIDLAFYNFSTSISGFDSSSYTCDPTYGDCSLATSGYYHGITSANEVDFSFNKIYDGDTYHFFNAPVVTTTPTTPAVPEPSSLALLGTGMLSSVTMLRRRFKK